ncbi:hypothetical protein ACHQM5_025912 [Ranunculus cassubicifolius]
MDRIGVAKFVLVISSNICIAIQINRYKLSAKCFQDLLLKDQNHPAALMNYAVVLLCKYGPAIAGAGANAAEDVTTQQLVAANVAKECLLAAAKSESRAAEIWANLANAHSMGGDHRSAGKCLEKAAKLEPSCMSTRYAVAVHRIKDVERSQDPKEQLSWAGNEMASILREGDTSIIEPHLGWAGLAMQAIEENPDDPMHWHQLGLYNLCTLQFKASQKYFKAAIARSKEFSDDPSQAEEVYKRALSLATQEQAHTMLSNLGNLYRQQRKYKQAKAMLGKSLELQPGYVPAYNNLGLDMFRKALKSDPLLDAAKSNMMKSVGMSRVYAALPASLLQD